MNDFFADTAGKAEIFQSGLFAAVRETDIFETNPLFQIKRLRIGRVELKAGRA